MECGVERRKKKEKSWWNRGNKVVAGFCAAVLFFALLSRAAASFLVPRVDTGILEEGKLIFEVEGQGTVVPESREFVYSVAGLRIKELYVREGQDIRQGDVIALVDEKELREKYEEERGKERKLEIQIEQTTLSAAADELPVTPENQMNQSYREEDVAEAERRLSEAKAAYEAAKTRSRERLTEVKRQNAEALSAAYEELCVEAEAALFKADEAAREAEARWKKAGGRTEAFDSLIAGLAFGEDGGAAENEAFLELLRLSMGDAYAVWQEEKGRLAGELAAARERLAGLAEGTEEYVQALEEIKVLEESLLSLLEEPRYTALKSSLEAYRDSGDKAALYLAVYGTDDYGAAAEAAEEAKKEWERLQEENRLLRESYDIKKRAASAKRDQAAKELAQAEGGGSDWETEIEAQRRAVEQAEKELTQAKRSRELGSLQLEQGERRDENARQEADEGEKRAALARESLLIDLAGQQKSTAALKELLDNGGKILSPLAGRVESIAVSAGQRITEEGILSVSGGKFELKMTAKQEDAGGLETGDDVLIRFPGRREGVESKVGSIGMAGEGEIGLTAVLTGDDYYGGMPASYRIRKVSESYERCVPLSALHQDIDGYYLLVVREKDSILGKINTAERMDVEVIDKDETTAALGETESLGPVILHGNRVVREGDRVRVNMRTE